MPSEKGGASFANERLGAKNPLQITIGTPAVFLQARLKLTSRGHFSTDMHLIIPKFPVRIAQGICFRKRYGFSIRKCTGIGKNNV